MMDTDDLPPLPPDRPPAERRRRGRISKADVDKQVLEGLAALYGATGTLWMLGNQYDGVVILSQAQKMAEADIAVCKQYPAAYEILKKIALGNVWTVLIMVHLPVVVAILSNHGVFPRSTPARFGLPEPPERTPRAAESGTASEPTTDVEAEMLYQMQMAQQLAAEREEYAAHGASEQSSPMATAGAAFGPGGPIGDAGNVAAARAYTAEQIAAIREQSLRQALADAQRAAASPESMPPAVYNPLGILKNNGGV